MNPLTESREALAAALTPLGVTIYGAPPESVTPPAAVLLPGNPWWSQETWGSIRVTWRMTLMATMQGANAAALGRLEQLVWDANAALEAVAVVGVATEPRILKIGPAEVAATDLPLQVLVSTEDTAEAQLQGAS